MASSDQQKPVTFGAIIEPPLRPQPSHDSAFSNTAEKETGLGFDSSNPYSAFYKHPCARRSMDGKDRDATLTTTSLTPAAAIHSKQHLDVSVRDVETGLTPLSAATTQTQAHGHGADGRVKECTMWPSRQAVLEKKKLNQRAKGWKLFGRLNSKQRLWAKILIALLVIAGAVGLGIGISKAVGGGVWKSKGKTQDIA